MTGFNIQEFSDNLMSEGVLYPSKFLVSIGTPTILLGKTINTPNDTNNTSNLPNLISFRACEAKIPGIALATNDVLRYGIGVSEKMPYNAAMTDNSITFISDGKGKLYNYFYSWMRGIFDFSGTENDGSNGNLNPSYKTEYKSNYQTDITVSLYDPYGKVTNSVKMYQAFPITLNDIPLAWEDKTKLLKITVGFTFKNCVLLNTNLTTPSTQ